MEFPWEEAAPVALVEEVHDLEKPHGLVVA